MKNIAFWRKSVYSAFIFFGTLIVLSVGYATLSWWLTSSDEVGTWSGLAVSSWNRIISGILELDGRTASISSSNGSLGVGTSSPAGSAILDVVSTSKGVIMPRMTKAQRNTIVSPLDGMIIYCTDCTPKWFKYRVNGKWLSKPTEDIVLTSTNPTDAIYSGDGDCVDNEAKTYMTPVTLTPWKWRAETNGTGYKYSGVATAVQLNGAPLGAEFGIPFNPGWYFWLYKTEDVNIASTTTFTPFLTPVTGCYQASLDKVYSFSIKFTLLEE